MKIVKLYILSLFIGYISFVICGITFMFSNDGIDDSLWKGIVLLAIGGVIYLPIFAISNLTQFLLLKKPNRKIIAFFSSILIIVIISFIEIKMNMMDDFLWKIFLPAQLIVSLIAFYSYQYNNKTNIK
jgi:hypothetical protein